MATLIFIWDAPGSKLATWPTATFAVYIAIHGHALRHGPPELYSYTALYIIQLYIAIHYTTSTTPLWGDSDEAQSPGSKHLHLWQTGVGAAETDEECHLTEASLRPVLNASPLRKKVRPS